MSFLTIQGARRGRIFLATLDPVALQWRRISEAEQARQIKLLVMLGYEVSTATPFFWQSPHARQVVGALPVLVESGQLSLLGRPGVTSAKDYLSLRRSDTSSISRLRGRVANGYASEVPPPDAELVAASLDRLTALVPRQGSVESLFKTMYLTDMEPTDAPGSIYKITDQAYPTRFSPVARSRHEVALTELGDLAFAPHFSRAVVQGGSKDVGFPETVGEALALRTTALYQTANAVAANATLFTWSRIAEHVPPGVDVVTELSLSHANPFLFQRVLMALGVPLRRFDAVPLYQLSRLATEAPQVAAFASWYSNLLRSVAGARGSSPVDAVALDHFAHHIEKMLSAQASRVKLRALVRLIERARFEWVIGLVTAGISYKLGAHPIAAGMTGSRTRRSVSRGRDFLLDRLEEAMQLELIDFSDMLEEEGLVQSSQQLGSDRSSRK